MNNDNVIKIAFDIKALTGQGTEYLVREDGVIAAQFYNGNILVAPTANPHDTTLKAA